MVLMITAINLLGMDWISRLSWLLFIVILTPFVIEVIMMLVQGNIVIIHTQYNKTNLFNR